MSPIKIAIIDDEANARLLLRQLLEGLSIPTQVIGEADDVATGVTLLKQNKAELVFLDIQLHSGTGFDVLTRLPQLKAEVVFVTAYDQYAIRAFDFAALGYLLKPVRISELREAIMRYNERKNDSGNDQRLHTLLTNAGNQSDRLVVPDLHGFRVIDPRQIVYLRGEVNYTRFFLADKSELLSSKTLKEYERLLVDLGFCRIHQSFLINLSHVNSYQRGEGGVVTLSNGDHLDVSRRRKADFMKNFLG